VREVTRMEMEAALQQAKFTENMKELGLWQSEFEDLVIKKQNELRPKIHVAMVNQLLTKLTEMSQSI
jgi:hypothetical protein